MRFGNDAKLTKYLVKELPYHGLSIPHAHGQFKDLLALIPIYQIRNILIDSPCSFYDLDLFSLNDNNNSNDRSRSKFTL